jgi:hypothetical protein
MRSFHSSVHRASVVAAFKQKTDAENVIRELREVGFGERHIGLFVWHPRTGLKSLGERDHALECTVIGAVLGVLFGLWVTPALANWLISGHNVLDLVQVTLISTAFASLLFGFLGWEIGLHLRERATVSAALDDEAGRFILTVVAGADSAWVWSVIRRHHGSAPQHLPTAHPHPV